MSSDESINFQVSLAKKVVTLTQGMDKDFQLQIYQEICKDIRTEKIGSQRNSNGGNNGDSKPTEKQVKFAVSLGIEKPEQYTKTELSKKIEEAKAR